MQVCERTQEATWSLERPLHQEDPCNSWAFPGPGAASEGNWSCGMGPCSRAGQVCHDRWPSDQGVLIKWHGELHCVGRSHQQDPESNWLAWDWRVGNPRYLSQYQLHGRECGFCGCHLPHQCHWWQMVCELHTGIQLWPRQQDAYHLKGQHLQHTTSVWDGNPPTHYWEKWNDLSDNYLWALQCADQE